MASSQNLEVHYIKSNDYKTDYVTGFYGGITNQGKLHMSYYLERPTLPKSVNLSLLVDEQGKVIGEPVETKKAGKEGIVRESQGGLIMDIVAAKALSQWLSDKIKEFETFEVEGSAQK